MTDEELKALVAQTAQLANQNARMIAELRASLTEEQAARTEEKTARETRVFSRTLVIFLGLVMGIPLLIFTYHLLASMTPGATMAILVIVSGGFGIYVLWLAALEASKK